MTSIDAILNQLREALKAELRDEVRAEIISELGGAPAKPKPSTGQKLQKLATKFEKKVVKFEKLATGALKVKAGTRRSEGDVAAAADTLHAWIKKNPGLYLADASKALKVPTKDLQLPLAKLKDEKRVTAKGERRWTTYTAKG